jgi:required for meiotic nuclear division protein 1
VSISQQDSAARSLGGQGSPAARRPITAIALSGSVNLVESAKRLPWPMRSASSHRRVYDVHGSRLYLFDFGGIVIEGRDGVDAAVASTIEQATETRLLSETRETYHLEIDPDYSGVPRVGWDVVFLPEANDAMLGAVALLLGQSAALERYERAAERLVQDALAISTRLQRRGRALRTSRTELKKIGTITTERLELASYFYLIDQPEETWEDSKVAALYDALFKNLELRERYSAVLQKLSSVENTLGLIIGLWQGLTSHRLEWAIVWLIVAEIVLALVGRL